MLKQRTHVIIPSELVTEIDELVGKRARSRFLTELAAQEVKRLRLLRALEHPKPAWKEQNHPELKAGSGAWVRKLRRQDERRFQRLKSR